MNEIYEVKIINTFIITNATIKIKESDIKIRSSSVNSNNNEN